MIRTPSIPTPFPYTTLFRSGADPDLRVPDAWPLGRGAVPHQEAARGDDRAGDGHRRGPVDGQGPRRGPGRARAGRGYPGARSEEHTSELQSHVNLVCRLLLE